MKLTMQSIITASHAAIYRLSGGRIANRIVGLDVLLLTTTGRKTGRKRTLPLTFLPDGKSFVVIASNGGAARHPGWYMNLTGAGRGQVYVRGKKFEVQPEILAGADRDQFWQLAVNTYPGYQAYAEKTTRQIPVVRLVPMLENI